MHGIFGIGVFCAILFVVLYVIAWHDWSKLVQETIKHKDLSLAMAPSIYGKSESSLSACFGVVGEEKGKTVVVASACLLRGKECNVLGASTAFFPLKDDGSDALLTRVGVLSSQHGKVT